MAVARTDHEVLQLAAKHLEKEHDATFQPPLGYLAALRLHLCRFPKDDHFVLSPGKGPNGYGILTCLEESCFCDIELTASEFGKDGGKSEGVGGLGAYQQHIVSSFEHQQARDARDARIDHSVLHPLVADDSNLPRSVSGAGRATAKPARQRVDITTVLGIEPSIARLGPRTGLDRASPAAKTNASTKYSVTEPSNKREVISLDNDGEDGRSGRSGGPSRSTPPVVNQERPDTNHQQIPETEAYSNKRRKTGRSHPSTGARVHGLGDSCSPNTANPDCESESDSYDSEDEHRADLFMAGASLGHNTNDSSGYMDQDNIARAINASCDFSQNVSVAAAREKLGLKTDQKAECMLGMATALKPHQHLGVAWMLEQERSPRQGGILADDMGLGKTLQAISVMIANPSSDPARKTNLVIAPLALLEQWKREIELHVDEGLLSVYIYHGEGKIRKVKKLQKYDIVLTTYHTMMTDFPDPKKIQSWTSVGGPMKRMRFYRVILDEGHSIRNRLTRASMASAALKARFRWVLTGTPITNSLNDVYSLMRFLGIRPYNSWDHFRIQITKAKEDLAAKRMQLVFRTCMLRRLKSAELEGMRLIELDSKKVIENVEITFSKEEQEIYDLVFTNSQTVINKFLRKGTILKNYANVLEHLLRLRQLCNHPHLIVAHIDRITNSGAASSRSAASVASELARAKREMGHDAVARLQERLTSELKEASEAEARGEDATIEMSCLSCGEPLGPDALVTRCGHEFCHECIHDWIDHWAETNDETDGGAVTCPKCRSRITKQTFFSRALFMPPNEEDESSARPVPGPSDAISNATDDLPKAVVTKFDPSTQLADSAPRSNAQIREQIANLPPISSRVPSAKMIYLLEYLQRLDIESPDEKVLVLSQFTSFLNLLDDYLVRNGFMICRFQGDMNPQQRQTSVEAFQGKKKVRVMLMSLKAGGVGLNLTRGNHVINMDKAWSTAVEHQAFDRCHRLGQRRDVHVKRPTIVNTVEERIEALQQKKAQLSDQSLGEGSGMKLGRLSIQEIANLFNLPRAGRS